MKSIKTGLILLFIIYWLPFLLIWSDSYPQENIARLPPSDAVIIFGTRVRKGLVSPLLKERLDAAMAIYYSKKAQRIVVSNRRKASLIMKQYLINHGVPAKKIDIDSQAERTPDTCRYEKKLHPQPRRLIFVSQGYHLARISYQCQKIGVSAVTYPAENIRNNRASLFQSFDIFWIRIKRYTREAGLTWLAFLNIYV